MVGTPGRVIDHIKRRTLDLSQLESLVLGEADEILNMGFLEDDQIVLEKGELLPATSKHYVTQWDKDAENV